MKKYVLYILSVITSLSACVPERTEKKVTLQPVTYSVVEKTAAFTPENTALTIDSMNNTLYVHFGIHRLKKNFPFPINRELNDTLTHTAFCFQFYCNGKPVLSDYNGLRRTLRFNKAIPDTELTVNLDTLDIKSNQDLFFEMPLYAFHNLKKGKQTLELRIWQDVFTDRAEIKGKDNQYTYRNLREQKKLFDARIKFDVVIPELYKAKVYGYGLQLKNDSTFSPVGMDNTLWKSSYPDIYWCIAYPKKAIYVQTDYETSTDTYTGLDTFTLYHYYKNDSIGFQVYDHDNLSRDDFLGSWWGGQIPLRVFPAVKEISFDNIRSFRVAIKEEGLVN